MKKGQPIRKPKEVRVKRVPGPRCEGSGRAPEYLLPARGLDLYAFCPVCRRVTKVVRRERVMGMHPAPTAKAGKQLGARAAAALVMSRAADHWSGAELMVWDRGLEQRLPEAFWKNVKKVRLYASAVLHDPTASVYKLWDVGLVAIEGAQLVGIGKDFRDAWDRLLECGREELRTPMPVARYKRLASIQPLRQS